MLLNGSLVPRPPPFFVLRFAFSIIHGSGRARYTERKPKNKKRGRPGNEAILMVQDTYVAPISLIRTLEVVTLRAFTWEEFHYILNH